MRNWTRGWCDVNGREFTIVGKGGGGTVGGGTTFESGGNRKLGGGGEVENKRG